MKYKVVIIDDEPLMRKSMRMMIDWEKYNCEICGEAEGAEEGLALIEGCMPDIIFTDIRLHEKTGLEMLHEIKNLPPYCKVIVITGYREFDYVLDALQMGVFAFLLKPLSAEEISENLQRAIDEINSEKSRDYGKMTLDTIASTKADTLEVLNGITNELLSLTEESGAEKINQLKKRIPEFLKTLREDDEIYKLVYRYLQFILFEIYVKSAGFNEYSQEFIMSNIERLVVVPFDYKAMDEWLLIQLDNISERCVSQKVEDIRVEEMLSYINDNYYNQITLEDVAKHVLISYHYASKLFKKHTGKSFVEYLNYIRIEKSKELCKNFRYRDHEIAAKVGVENVYYFSRLFKKYTGMSVTEYRKKYN